MTSIEQTAETLRKLRLYGMARAYTALIESPNDALGAHELINYLVDTEWSERKGRSVERLIRFAKFRYTASLSELYYFTGRGLDPDVVQQLASGVYLQKAQNVLISGPTGTGKSYLATALGHQACHIGRKVLYSNTARLTTRLKQAKTDGKIIKDLERIAQADLLILDDFGLQVLDSQSRSILMDIMEDRHDRKSTMVVGQVPVSSWYEVIGDETMADALMDRWVHGAYSIELAGESLRKRDAPETKSNAKKYLP